MSLYHKILSATGLLAFSALFLFGHSKAATSYDVTNEVQMYLNSTINATTATGIVLASPKRNGVNHTFGTLSGGVLRLRQGSKVEDIYYTLAEVRSDNTVNLQGVTRNLCTGIVKAYVSCGNGKQFSRGSIVELNNDARIFNLKANIDRPTRTIESGAYICGATSQPCLFPGSYTTAQRDAFTYTNSSAFHLIFNSTLGVAQYYNPTTGTYLDFGSGAITNSTTTTAGSVELAGTGDTIQMTGAGDSGAQTVLTAVITSMTGGLTSDIGKLPILNANGVLNPSLGGTGTGGSFMGSGGLLVTNGTGAMKAVYAGADNEVLTASNGIWVSSALSSDTTLLSTVAQGADMDSGTYNTGAVLTVSGSTIGTGATFEMKANIWSGGGTRSTRVTFNGVTIAENANSGADTFITCIVTVRENGSTGVAIGSCVYNLASSNVTYNSNATTFSINTVDPHFEAFAIQGKQTSGAENNHFVEQFLVTKHSPLKTSN